MSAAQRLDVAGQLLRRLAHGCAHGVGVVEARRARQEHLQAAERLQRLVVQLARPAVALGLGRRQRAAPAVGLDRLGRGHGRRRLRREGLQQLLVVAGEGAVARRGGRRPRARRGSGRGTRAGPGARSRRGRARADRAGSGARGPRRRCVGSGLRRAPGPPSTPPAAAAPHWRSCTWPAPAAMTSSSPSRSMMRTSWASISARPRLTTSSRMRSSSVSPPTARAMAAVACSPRTARSSSSRRAATSR